MPIAGSEEGDKDIKNASDSTENLSTKYGDKIDRETRWVLECLVEVQLKKLNH